jgi:hypothetical protein
MLVEISANDIALDIKKVLKTAMKNGDGFIVHSANNIQDLLNIELLYKYTKRLPSPYNIPYTFTVESNTFDSKRIQSLLPFVSDPINTIDSIIDSYVR